MTLALFAAAASVGSGVICLFAWLTWRRRPARRALYFAIATGIASFLIPGRPPVEAMRWLQLLLGSLGLLAMLALAAKLAIRARAAASGRGATLTPG